jgi:hypothetical protein
VGKKRKSAKARREEHEVKVRRRKVARGELVEPVPVVDKELAKEIEAIKADDVRKGKYYNRRKDV